MSDGVPHLVLDTQVLVRAGWNLGHPDFRKLLQYCEEGKIKITVPFIVWEERRTQLLQEARKRFITLQSAYEVLQHHFPKNLILDGVPQPVLNALSLSDLEEQSITAMNALASKYKMEIRPLGTDHAQRAWKRFFSIELPFNPDEERVERRKDIPDSWILESILDIRADYPNLVVICGDKKLAKALESIDIRVIEEIATFLNEFESAPAEKAVASANEAEQPNNVPPLDTILSKAGEEFRHREAQLLGYVGFLKNATKDELLGLLVKTGMSPDLFDYVASGLVLAQLIEDTGNYFIPKNREAGEIAAASVEKEIIKLLEGAQ